MFIIGDRINPSGKPDLARAIREGKKTLIQQEAIQQERAGAQALDVNVFLPDVERIQAMRIVVEGVRAVSELPLAIDDRDPETVEIGVSRAGRDSWINSPMDVLEPESKMVSLALRFQSGVLCLPLKQGRIPGTPKEHLEMSRAVVKHLTASGLNRDRIMVDAVLLALKSAGDKVLNTLETIRLLKSELSVRVVMGLSNLSYGLKRREELNARFLHLAKAAGLDAAILNPLEKKVMAVATGQTDRESETTPGEFLEFAEACWA